MTALDFPGHEGMPQRMGDPFTPNFLRQTGREFTDSMAGDCWAKWNPEQRERVEDSRFLACFKGFLVDGLQLGYRLDRFRAVSSLLPDPGKRAKNWIPYFEEALAGDDCCSIRLFLSREMDRTFRVMPQGSPGDSQTWDDMLLMMADGLFYELGLVFRPLSISVDEELPPTSFRCEWNDLRLPPQQGLDFQSLLVNDTVDRLTLLNIRGEAAINPANGIECAIIDNSCRLQAEQAGLTTWDPRGYVILALSSAIRQAAGALINRQLYQLYLYNLREYKSRLIPVVADALDPDFMVQVLRGLLSEEISIRNLSQILDAALELRATINVDTGKYIVFPPTTGGVHTNRYKRTVSDLMPCDYVEFIRARLKRYISHKYTRGSSTLVVYLMNPRAEEVLADSQNPAPDVEAAILKAVRDEVGSLPSTTQSPVILTTMEVRRRLRGMISPEFPHLAVLSYQELSPDLNIQPIARINPDL